MAFLGRWNFASFDRRRGTTKMRSLGSFISSVVISVCLIFVAATILLEFAWLGGAGNLSSYVRLYMSSDGLDGGVEAEASDAAVSVVVPVSDMTASNLTHYLPVQSPLDRGNDEVRSEVAGYVRAIMTPEDDTFLRMRCPNINGTRYDILLDNDSHTNILTTTRTLPKLPKHFFALDLHQSAELLPRLLGSTIEAILFLGVSACVLSIVEGRSTDLTLAILTQLKQNLTTLGINYHLTTSSTNPLGARNPNRIVALAELRNQALLPLTQNPSAFAQDTTVVFINDVALCRDDILELMLQRVRLGADMTCAMDWTYAGADPTFYDVWIARSMKGDSFFDIPPDGSWDLAWNMFWNDEATRGALHAFVPFQVYSCWNGAVAFTAAPLLAGDVAFRGLVVDGCFQGEPQMFCADLWALGFGRIAVVPVVNIAYSDGDGERIKALKGHVSEKVSADGLDGTDGLIQWVPDPPPLVKCIPTYENQYWVAWNESLVPR